MGGFLRGAAAALSARSGSANIAAARIDEAAPERRGPPAARPAWRSYIRLAPNRLGVEIIYWAETSASGPPRQVTQAAESALKARTIFSGHGFLPPLGADPLLRIQILPILPRGMTNPDWDHIKIDEGLMGRDLDYTITHEIFHRIQYAYNPYRTAYDWHATANGDFALGPMLREGGARLAEELFNNQPGDLSWGRYAVSAAAWMSGRGVSLVTSPTGAGGAPQGAAYEAGLFWKYFAEQHGGRPDRRGGRRGPRLTLEDIRLYRHAREVETQKALLEATSVPGTIACGPAAGPPARADEAAPARAGTPAQHRPRMHHLREARHSLLHGGPGHFDRFCYLDQPAERDGPQVLPGGGTPEPSVPAERLELLSETSWGNFLVALALNGTAGEDSRFQFEDAREWRGQGAARRTIDAARRVTFEQLPKPDPDLPRRPVEPLTFEPEYLGNRLIDPMMRGGRAMVQSLLGGQVPANPARDPQTAQLRARMLSPYAMTPYAITMPARLDTVLLKIGFAALSGLEDALVQVIMLDRAGRLRDIHRIDGMDQGSWERTFACRDLGEVLILVASREKGGDYRLRLSGEVGTHPLGGDLGKPILFIAPMNALPGRNLTEDPAVRQWDWMSPDIDASDPQRRGFSVVVRNIGTAPARDVTVRAWRRLRSGAAGAAWEELAQVDLPSGDLISDDECRRRYTVFATAERNCGVLNGLTSGRAHFFAAIHGGVPPRTSAQARDFGRFEDYIVKIEASCGNDPNRKVTVISCLAPGAPPALPRPWRDGSGRPEPGATDCPPRPARRRPR